MLLLAASPLTSLAQMPPTQTPRVGIVFLQFLDHASNPDAKGSVGFDRGTGPEYKKARRKLDPKYAVHDYWDVFFKEHGWLAHPDSFSHGARYTGLWTMGMKGSLRTWARENSYGIHDVIPFNRPGHVPGILNRVTPSPGDTAIMNGHVDWITISGPKSFFFTNQDPIRPYYYLQWECEHVFDSEFMENGIRWWREDLDIVYIICAGSGSKYMQTFEGLEASHLTPRRPIMIFIPEKTSNPGDPQAISEMIFQYNLTSVVHEYVHATSFFLKKKFWDLSEPRYSSSHYVGEFGNYNERQQTPPHLDPWRKLQLGWLDWQIVAGNARNMPLPAVERPENGRPPRVAVIPLQVPRGWTDEPDWMKGHYLIIENRRSDGFDQYITADQNTYENIPQSPGGFLVWEFVDSLLVNEDDGVDGLSLIEADGRNEVKLGGKLPRGSIFFSHPQIVTMWTNPDFLGIESFSWKGKGDVYARSSGPQLSITFGDYSATREHVNSIPLIEFSAPTANSARAFEGSGQRKIASHGGDACMVQTIAMGDSTEGIVLAHTSTNAGKTWTTTHLLNRLRLKSGWILDKTAEYPASAPSVAFFDPADRGDGAFHVVWQENVHGAYRIMTAIPGKPAVEISPTTFFAPFNGLPAPVIRFRDGIARVVYASVLGLMETFSADNGATWSTPSVIDGTTAHSGHPTLTTSSGHDLLMFEDVRSGVSHLYCSVDGGTPVQWSSSLANSVAHSTPSVALQNDTAHVTWIAGMRETIGGVPMVRPRIMHGFWPVASPVTDMVVSTLDPASGAQDVPANPVVAASPAGGVTVAWSVSGMMKGTRVRLATRAQGAWIGATRESAIRDSVGAFPLLFDNGTALRYCVTLGATNPRRIIVRDITDPADSLIAGGRPQVMADARFITHTDSPVAPAAIAVRLWPNPSVDVLHVAVPTGSLTGEVDAAIHSVHGRRLLTSRITDNGTGVYSLDVRGVPAGVHLLTLQSGSACVSTRVTVSR